MSRSLMLGLAIVLVFGAIGVIVWRGGRDEAAHHATEEIEGGIASLDDEGDAQRAPATLPGTDITDGVAKTRILQGLRVLDVSQEMPIVAVPDYNGVGLDRVNLRAWLLNYGPEELPKGEAEFRTGLIYERAMYGMDEDAGAALQFYMVAEEKGHDDAHRRAEWLRSKNVKPRWPY